MPPYDLPDRQMSNIIIIEQEPQARVRHAKNDLRLLSVRIFLKLTFTPHVSIIRKQPYCKQ